MAVVEELEEKLADITAQIQWERNEIVVLESPSPVDVKRSFEKMLLANWQKCASFMSER